MLQLKQNTSVGIIFFLILSLGVLGCYKDKGNYDYLPKNAITISGVDSTYIIMAGETLKITPKIDALEGNPDDTTRFTYKWLMESGSIGNQKDLEVQITADVFNLNQTSTVYFVVIDNVTAARQQFIVRIEVTTETSFTKKGWYVLSEVNEGSRLSLISHTTSPNVLYKNVLETIGSALFLKDKGRPISLAIDYNSNLTVSTEKTSVYLPVLDGLDWNENMTTLSQFIASPPSNTLIEYAGPLDIRTRETNIIFANNNYYIESPQYEDFYGRPINQYDLTSVPFKASPYFGSLYQERGILMFDMEKRQFALYRLSFAASSTTPILSLQVEGEGLQDLPVNKELRYMARVRYPNENGQIFAIMKDQNGKYTFLRIEGRVSGRSSIVLKQPESEISAIDFDKAEHITFHPVYGYIYYNVGSKIYAYDPIGTKTSKLMMDLGSEKISLLEFSISNSNAFRVNPEELRKLAVGSYNPSEGESGKLSFYNVPSAMGAITPVGDSYTGFGIIKSIVFAVD